MRMQKLSADERKLNQNRTGSELLQSSHSIQDHWITLDGGRMRYLRDGSGPPLVLLHGLLGYSFSWRHAMPVLARHATVHAVDMLGAGFSDRPRGLDGCLRQNAERLLRFMDAVGIARSDLLGSSHGGAVAMMVAAVAPERIRRLILVAPVNPWSTHGKVMAAILSSHLIAPIFLCAAPHLRIAHSVFLRRLYGDTARIRPGTLEGYAAPLAVPGTFDYGLSVLRSWSQDLQELKSLLPRIADIPTLLMWGSVDAAVDPSSAVRLQENLTDCQLVTFEDVGHLPYEEVPEQFNSAVIEFLLATKSGKNGATTA
jgi:pimeloyl-ACP methyl ester carboxylesterase